MAAAEELLMHVMAGDNPLAACSGATWPTWATPSGGLSSTGPSWSPMPRARSVMPPIRPAARVSRAVRLR